MDEQPLVIPDWVLTEIGRLHLHALALERELRERDQFVDMPIDDLLPPPGVVVEHDSDGGVTARHDPRTAPRQGQGEVG